MRRRSNAPDEPAGLAWSDFADDGDRFSAFERWRQARREWVAAGNVWPGGESAMEQQELDMAGGIPDEPFTVPGGHYFFGVSVATGERIEL